mmetsp:Transcript_102614/g.257182  ORF Transcript_102614/g.257182 Transcript_102614/m.257182 type:complete len:252 (+) Transcript_102614:286-1041(+)
MVLGDNVGPFCAAKLLRAAAAQPVKGPLRLLPGGCDLDAGLWRSSLAPLCAARLLTAALIQPLGHLLHLFVGNCRWNMDLSALCVTMMLRAAVVQPLTKLLNLLFRECSLYMGLRVHRLHPHLCELLLLLTGAGLPTLPSPPLPVSKVFMKEPLNELLTQRRRRRDLAMHRAFGQLLPLILGHCDSQLLHRLVPLGTVSVHPGPTPLLLNRAGTRLAVHAVLHRVPLLGQVLLPEPLTHERLLFLDVLLLA